MTHIPTGPHSGKGHTDAILMRRGFVAGMRFCAPLLCLILLAVMPGALRAAPTEALLAPPAVSAQKVMVPPILLTPNAPLLPKLQYFIDQTGTMDVEEVATPANASAFLPLNMKTLPRSVGIMWLRFTLAPLPQGAKAGAMLLDMGASVPDGPVLYEPHVNPLTENVAWREIVPTQRNVLLLPEATSEPLTCYIRLDGVPGLWFEPTLRTPHDAANNWGSLAGTAAILALGVVMLLCLLRGLSEKGQWRVWTALYVAAALAQAIMGMPAYGSGHITLHEAAAVLSPGVALMLLPHVGRHLLRTKQRSRLLDAQFVLLSLPGAALALLPLLPGFSWLIRYLALWPLCTLIFVPSAIGGAVMGLGGARRFLLGCLLPPLFVVAGILGLDSGYAANLMASAPLWGTALSALIIAGTGAPRDMAQSAADDKSRKSKKKGNSLPGLEGMGGPGMPDVTARALDSADTTLMMEDGAINLDQPLDDPNLRLLPPSPAASGTNAWKRPVENAPLGTPGQPNLSWGSDASPETAPAPASAANGNVQSAFAGADPCLWENALRAPLDRLMREGAALNNCSLPPAVRQHAEHMLEAATDLAHAVDNPGKGQGQSAIGEPRSAFNLQQMVRAAHDAVSTTAENAGIGLAWYMPPLLGHMYEGQAQTLRETLCLLLESAVRATTRGAVHLSVRRVPESADPGHLLFTVTDTGAGLPPRNRSTLALTRAWELAGTNNCYLNVECGPQGTTISFTLRLKPLEQEAAEPKPREAHITIVADRAVERQDLAHMAAAQGLQSTEARTMREALELNKEAPALLLVVHSPMDGPAETDALERFKNQALGAGLPFFRALAITADDSRWDALAESGYTHALLEPVERAAFAVTVREIYDEAGFSLPEADAPGMQLPPESVTAQVADDAVAAAMAATGASFDAEEAQSAVPGVSEASHPELPDLFGASSAWPPHDANSLRLPDLTSLPQILDMTDQMRETALPWPEHTDAAAADATIEPHKHPASRPDASSAVLVADAGVLLPYMAPLPEQPEDPNDPDMPDLSNLESLQLPLPGIAASPPVDEAAGKSEEFSTDLGFESFAEPEPLTPQENAHAGDTYGDEAADVSDAAGMPDAGEAMADVVADADADAADALSDTAGMPAAGDTADVRDATGVTDVADVVSDAAEDVATAAADDGTQNQHEGAAANAASVYGGSSQSTLPHDEPVDAADFIAAAGLEGPQWDEEAIVAAEPSVDTPAPESALSGPEQAMPQAEAMQQPDAQTEIEQQPADTQADLPTPTESHDFLDYAVSVPPETPQLEQIPPAVAQSAEAQTAPLHAQYDEMPEEAATERVEAVEGEYQAESFATAEIPAEAQPLESSPAEVQSQEHSPAEAQPGPIDGLWASDSASEHSVLEEAPSVADGAPQSSPDDTGSPAASLAAAINSSAAHAGQPVIVIQGKIGEAILRPVNAPVSPSATDAVQTHAAPSAETAVQKPPQPEAFEMTTAATPPSASPEEYLDRNLSGSGAALHESLNWGDEWVGEPMPVGTALSADGRSADAGASQTAEASQAMKGAAKSPTYVTPSLSSPGEWVGEPMPVGTAFSADGRGADASASPTAETSQAMKGTPKPPTYVSPSLSSPGEWVGEPMPIAKNAAADKPEAPAQATAIEGQSPSLSNIAAMPSDAPTRSLRAIPWPGPNLSETKEVAAATAPAAVVSKEPAAPAQKQRELPRTATGRLILKLLGNVAASEPVPAPTAEPAVVSALQSAVSASAPATAAKGHEKPPVASRAATTRLGADSEPAFVDFIAGATPPSAEHASSVHTSAVQPFARRDQETGPTQAFQTAAPMSAEGSMPAQPVLPVQEDKTLIQLVHRLDAAMEEAQQAYKGRSCHAVGAAANRIANDSDAFGFRVLARMARCVERAAKANDINALRDLLPELSVAVERNRIALNPRHQGR